jgi:CHASE3 domain sensor protein
MADGNPTQQVLIEKPDPTVLTTQQINERVSGLREVIEARLNGMDKAVDLLQKRADASPSVAQVNDSVVSLRELHNEKFSSIQTQFRERDIRTEQTARDSKIAIDAALQAAKEAVGKTEQTFTKQIDQITSLITANAKALDEKVNDVKDRLTTIEARAVGTVSATMSHQQQARDNTGLIAMIISGIAAAVAVAGFIVVRLTTS